MAYITAKELEEFERKYPKDGDTQPENYCIAAMEMIENYLGYDPELKEYTTVIRGDNGSLGRLEAQPITEITSVKIDGEDFETEKIEIVKKNYICFENDALFEKHKKYKITYKAGFENVPELIRQTALQIASLFWESAGGNLAVSSTSFADTGSRVFNNFKADRFLEQIQKYKIME